MSTQGAPEKSAWNLALEAILSRPHLTLAAHRLYLVLMREILGFRRREDRLGEDLLRRRAQLHGWTFTRARQELIDCGLLRYEPGSKGPGHRSLYRLLLPAEELGIDGAGFQLPAQLPAQIPAVERGILPAVERGRSVNRSESSTSDADLPETIVADVPTNAREMLEWLKCGSTEKDAA
jgi:hypothetical protein